MPNIKTHILVAEKLNELYGYDSDKFIIGNILPDMFTTDHYKSHFNSSFTKYDYNRLLNRYKKYFDEKNPFLIGYLSHILLDDYFNEHFTKKIIFKDNVPIGINSCICPIMGDARKIFEMKHDDLDNYDEKLINTYDFKKIEDFSVIDEIPSIPENKYSKEKIVDALEKHNRQIDEFKDENRDYNFIIYSEDEIDYLLDKSVSHVDKKIKSLLLKK